MLKGELWTTAATGITWIGQTSASAVPRPQGATPARIAAPESVWDPPAGSVEMSAMDLHHAVHIRRFKKIGLSGAAAEAKWETEIKPRFQNMKQP